MITYIILSLCALLILYPLCHIVMLSFSDNSLASSGGFFFLPRGFNINSYEVVFQTNSVLTAYGNTIFIVVVGTVINVFLTMLTAYPLSKPQLYGGKLLTFLLLFTMMFTGGMIPTYMMVKNLGLINSLWSLILPNAIRPFLALIMINFFRTIPASLEESANIDGANDFTILFKIVAPLSLPSLATIALMYAILQWNLYFDCVLYINKTSRYVLQVILREVILKMDARILTDGAAKNSNMFWSASSETVKMALVVITTFPILMVYPFLQKYFVKGVTLGAVKG